METRIGVFLCNCGGAIKNIDFNAIAKKVAKLPGVTCVNLSSVLCLEEGRKKMLSSIQENNAPGLTKGTSPRRLRNL